jgi:hypothetical protein
MRGISCSRRRESPTPNRALLPTFCRRLRFSLKRKRRITRVNLRGGSSSRGANASVQLFREACSSFRHALALRRWRDPREREKASE